VNNVIAITIAVAKAILIMLYFMHLRYSTRLMRLVAFAACLWLGILVGLTFSDYQARTETPADGLEMRFQQTQSPAGAIVQP
jgi:cytochrome c oxidase subunit 4